MRFRLVLAVALALALACGGRRVVPVPLDLAYTLDSPPGLHPERVLVDGGRDLLVVAFSSIDIHSLEDLVERGCPLDTAVRIAA